MIFILFVALVTNSDQIIDFMSKKLFPVINLEMPDDVRCYVIKFQASLKIKRESNQYSLQRAIFQIVREHEELSKDKKD